jgi:hypothetical protein
MHTIAHLTPAGGVEAAAATAPLQVPVAAVAVLTAFAFPTVLLLLLAGARVRGAVALSTAPFVGLTVGLLAGSAARLAVAFRV